MTSRPDDPEPSCTSPRLLALLLAVAGLTAPAALAEAPDAPSPTGPAVAAPSAMLSAEDLVHRALATEGWRHDADTPEAVSALAAGRAAGTVADPELRVNMADLGSWSTQPTVGLTLRVKFPQPALAVTEARAGQASAEAARARAHLAQRQVAAEVLGTARLLTVLQETAAHRRRQLQDAQALLDLRQRQREEGLATGLDVLDATAELTAVRRQVAELASRRHRLAARLARWLGLDDPDDLPPLKLPPLPEDHPPLADLLAAHPQLTAAEQERLAAEARLRGARLAPIPWVSFVDGELDTRAGEPTDVGLEVGIRLPLWDAHRSDRLTAKSDLAVSERALAQARLSLAEALHQAMTDLSAARAHRTAAEQAEATAREAASAIDPSADPLLALQVRMRLAEVLVDLQAARARHVEAQAAFDALSGQPLPGLPPP